MFHFHQIRADSNRPSGFSVGGMYPVMPIIAIPFLVGLVLGSLAGLLNELPQELLFSLEAATAAEQASFLQSLWRSCRYSLAAALLATGVLGVALIPLLSAFRAFSLSCCISLILCGERPASLALALVSLGIPALISLPAFFLVSEDGLAVSRFLLTRGQDRRIHEIPLARHALIAALLSLADAVYLAYLMPLLLGRFG